MPTTSERLDAGKLGLLDVLPTSCSRSHGDRLPSDLYSGEMLQAQSRLSAEQAGELIRAAQQEVEHSQMFWTLAFAFGQKPGIETG